MSIKVINPANGNTINEVELITDDQAASYIEEAHNQYGAWKTTHFEYRAKMMKKTANILLERQEELSQLMTKEMGKPIQQARAEVEKCAWVCRYYADHAKDMLEPELIETDASKSFVCYNPIGVVLAVMPWNFPLWQVYRFAAPALMAGNAGILKHASNVPGCAMAIEEIFVEAGFPQGLFKTLLISSDQVEKVIENKKVQAVTLTGSGPAGSAVAATAGKNIKKTVLELGGSDAYLILKDADLEPAAETCTTSRLLNSGQSCIGAKRFIVVKEVYDKFVKLFKEKMEAAKLGDPMNEDTDIGPMARFDLRDELHEQVKESIENGAECILGGEIPSLDGAYYPATILVNVKPGMPAYEDELFGPVASVIKAKDEDDAIRIANDSVFGLGAAVFTQDLEKGEFIAQTKLEAGSCFVNAFVKSDPRLPFGGIKTSGYGRELSHNGIKEFLNIKTVYIK
jgi:succinate-semialdehyde dehydrogenase/glutarate-semialdehyde dehydrogenase